MKKTILSFFITSVQVLYAQNPIFIPPAMSGTTFNLIVQSGSKTFYGNNSTPTYGINGSFLSPTIIVNKGDSIVLHVNNTLNVNTTMHWHGLHVSAKNDGGPHQIIKPATTWSPKFTIRNHAGTFWYHPHGSGQTEQQVSKGLAGMFIVKDSIESTLPLPRTYGVDDIPLIVQTKAFDALWQIAIASDMDTSLFVNGTLNPLFNAPAQVVRFRILNGSSLRSFLFGFSNQQSFYQIATDGGLMDTSIEKNRLLLSPGERAEILINFAGMNGQNLFLKSFASELPTGIYGADSVGNGSDTIHEYKENPLNGADFNVLQINIEAQSLNPVIAIPSLLVPYTPFNTQEATHNRTLIFDTLRLLPIDAPNRAEGPFGINNKSFDMDFVNETVHLNTTEIWTLVNKTLIAHPFHIHDIQFNILEKSGLPPLPSERGWKDVVLVLPNDSVKFITRFETFADNTTPYMYHCHLLHHEDDGMMGSFIVIDTTESTGMQESTIENEFHVFPNPVDDELQITLKHNETFVVTLINAVGQQVYKGEAISTHKISTTTFTRGLYFVHVVSDHSDKTFKILKP